MKILQPTFVVVLAFVAQQLRLFDDGASQERVRQDAWQAGLDDGRATHPVLVLDETEQFQMQSSLQRRLGKTWPDMIAVDDAAKCEKQATFWNRCNSGSGIYPCASCHESNSEWNSCPEAAHPACAGGTAVEQDCYKTFTAKVWPASGFSVVQTHIAGDTTPQTTGQDSDYFSSVAACEPIHCWIIGSTSNPNWGQTWDQTYLYAHDDATTKAGGFVTLDKLTGVFSYTREKPFYLNIEFRCDNGFQQYNYAFDISVTCGTTSTAITKPASWVQHQIYTISLTDTWEPNASFDDFVTSDPHCPLYERKVWADAGYSTALSNGLLGEVYRNESQASGANHRYYVQTSMPLKYMKGVYPFYIEAKARGASSLQTGQMTLTVICGPLSTNITESTYDLNQEYEVGSTHGFYFHNFSSFSDCPALTYRILLNDGSSGPGNLHPDFPLASNISVTNQTFLMVARVQDSTVEATYTFRIEVEAEGGYIYQTNARTVEFKCYSNLYSIYAPFDLAQNVVYYKGVSGTWEKYLYSNFTTGHAYCHVKQYELDDNADGSTLVTSVDTRWNTGCDAVHFCSDIEIRTDYARNFTFWLIVYADGNLRQSWPINVVVKCGLETLTLTQPSWTKVWPKLPSGSSPYNIHLLNDGLAAIFVTSLAQCPIREYNLYNDPETQWPILDNSTLELNYYQNPSLSNIDVNSTTTFYRTVYLQAVTEGNNTIALPLTIAICGLEEQYAKSEVTDYVYDHQSTLTPLLGPQMPVLEPLFGYNATSRSSPACENKALKLYEDAALTVPWVMDPNNPTVELIDLGGNQYRIKVYDDNKFKEKILYLTRETWGGVKAGAPLAFEVCGLENVLLTNGYDPTIHVNFTQYTASSSGGGYIQKISLEDYRGNFTTNSRLCQARYFEMYERRGYHYKTHSLVQVDPADQSILVNTMARMSKLWYLAPLGHANIVYLPINITILPPDTSDVLPRINEPPSLNNSLEDFQQHFQMEVMESKFYVEHTNVSNYTADEHLSVLEQTTQYTQTFRLPLGPIHDDLDRFYKLHVYSSFLGQVEFNNFTKEVTKAEADQILGFDEENNTLTFTFTSYSQARDNAGLHFLKINLTDDISKYRRYTPIVLIQPVPFSEYNFSPVDDSNFPTAKVKSVSPYGDVTIAFNKMMKTEGLSIADINQTLLDISLAPHRDWHKEYDDFNMTKFNLTWNVTAFHGNILVLKVNFTDPRYISTQEVRDRLRIHIKDTEDAKSQTLSRLRNKRKLQELITLDGFKFTESTNVVETYVNRQVPHNWEYLNSIFELMADIMWVCLWLSIFLNYFFGFPLTMMVFMLNSIAFVMHFPLLEVFVPMNAMLYLQRVLPVGNYDLFQKPHWMKRMFRTSNDHYDFEDIRPQVSFLGYDQFNPFVNIGTIALFVWIYLVQVCFLLLILVPLRVCCKCNGEAKWKLVLVNMRNAVFDLVVKQAFFGQILWLLVLGFMPIVTTVMLTFLHDPHSDGFNLVSAILFATFTVIVLPLVLIFLLTRKNWKLNVHELQFQRVWGVYFRGIRLRHRQNLSYYLFFFFRRCVLLALISEAALLASKSIQVVSVHLLNLFILIYTAHARPFNHWVLNFLVLWDEMLIFMCTCHLNGFTEWIDDVELQYDLGISLIVFMNLHIWATLIPVLFYLIRGFCIAARYLLAKAMLKYNWPWLMWLVHPWDSLKYTWRSKWLPALRASKLFGPCTRRLFGKDPGAEDVVSPFAQVRDFAAANATGSGPALEATAGGQGNNAANGDNANKKKAPDSKKAPAATPVEPVVPDNSPMDKQMDAWMKGKGDKDKKKDKDGKKRGGKDAKAAPRLDPYQPTHFLVGGRLLPHVDTKQPKEEPKEGQKPKEEAPVVLERAIIANNAQVINGDDRWKHQAEPVKARKWDWRDVNGAADGAADPDGAQPAGGKEDDDVADLLNSLQVLQTRAKERYGGTNPTAREKKKEARKAGAGKAGLPRPNDIGFDEPVDDLEGNEASVATSGHFSTQSARVIKPTRKGGPIAPAEKLALAPRMIHLASALQPLRGGPPIGGPTQEEQAEIDAKAEEERKKKKKADKAKHGGDADGDKKGKKGRKGGSGSDVDSDDDSGSDKDGPGGKKGKKNKKDKKKKDKNSKSKDKKHKKNKKGKRSGSNNSSGSEGGSSGADSQRAKDAKDKLAASQDKKKNFSKDAIQAKLKQKMQALAAGVQGVKAGASDTLKRGIDKVVNNGNRFYQDDGPTAPQPAPKQGGQATSGPPQPKSSKPHPGKKSSPGKPGDSPDLDVQSIEAGESAHNQVGDLGDLEANSEISFRAKEKMRVAKEAKDKEAGKQPAILVHDQQPNTVVDGAIAAAKSQAPKLVSKAGEKTFNLY